MKILSLISSFLQGGAQNVLVDIVTELSEHEHRVVHFTGRKNIPAHQPYVNELDRAGVPCIDAPWRSLDTEDGRREVLQDFQPDVVLCHWWGHDPWLPWVLESTASPFKTGPTFICVMHHYGIASVPGYDRYVLVTEVQRPQCHDLPSWRIRVIPNGVDLSRFEGLRRTRLPGDELVVGRLSMLRPGKIPENWIQTAASYRLPDTRYIIGGSGELLSHLAGEVQKLRKPGVFSLPGNVSRAGVPEFLAQLDVFCYVTSDAVECSPLALIEAQASGLPIVAEARGGIPDIVVHGQNGLLAESSSEVGEHLRQLQRQPQLVARLSRGALETAGRFSMDRQIFAYRELLTELETPSRAKVYA